MRSVPESSDEHGRDDPQEGRGEEGPSRTPTILPTSENHRPEGRRQLDHDEEKDGLAFGKRQRFRREDGGEADHERHAALYEEQSDEKSAEIRIAATFCPRVAKGREGVADRRKGAGDDSAAVLQPHDGRQTRHEEEDRGRRGNAIAFAVLHEHEGDDEREGDRRDSPSPPPGGKTSDLLRGASSGRNDAIRFSPRQKAMLAAVTTTRAESTSPRPNAPSDTVSTQHAAHDAMSGRRLPMPASTQPPRIGPAKSDTKLARASERAHSELPSSGVVAIVFVNTRPKTTVMMHGRERRVGEVEEAPRRPFAGGRRRGKRHP
jgi:hypothetical protein